MTTLYKTLFNHWAKCPIRLTNSDLYTKNEDSKPKLPVSPFKLFIARIYLYKLALSKPKAKHFKTPDYDDPYLYRGHKPSNEECYHIAARGGIVKRMAQELGWDRKSVQRALKALADEGFITDRTTGKKWQTLDLFLEDNTDRHGWIPIPHALLTVDKPPINDTAFAIYVTLLGFLRKDQSTIIECPYARLTKTCKLSLHTVRKSLHQLHNSGMIKIRPASIDSNTFIEILPVSSWNCTPHHIFYLESRDPFCAALKLSYGTIREDPHGTIREDPHGTIREDPHGTIRDEHVIQLENDIHEKKRRYTLKNGKHSGAAEPPPSTSMFSKIEKEREGVVEGEGRAGGMEQIGTGPTGKEGLLDINYSSTSDNTFPPTNAESGVAPNGNWSETVSYAELAFLRFREKNGLGMGTGSAKPYTHNVDRASQDAQPGVGED